MRIDSDALVVGAGVAGAACAVLLAQAGWRVVLAEQHSFPRRKVCGECIAAGNLGLLDELGIGAAFRLAAGPELRQVGWMDRTHTVTADMPACGTGPYRYGRAMGRDRLDWMLLERARSVGVVVLQPVRVRNVQGVPGAFDCRVESSPAHGSAGCDIDSVRARVVIDAHGSWERAPDVQDGAAAPPRRPRRASDLFAFKATYSRTALRPGWLPVLALPGGYGGMVVADGGRTTLACCIRRDALAVCRAMTPDLPAGPAVEAFLLRSCKGVHDSLQGAQREGPWLSVGPLNPGMRLGAFERTFRIGNAAGESHPLIGEGISMALQSAAMLAAELSRHPPSAIAAAHAQARHDAYAANWRRAFAPRLRLAALYAHVAMRPVLARPARELLGRWPALLGIMATLAGKTAGAAHRPTTTAETA